MACTGKIVDDIVSNCDTQGIGGLEAVAYLINRVDFEPTFDVTNGNLITAVATAIGTKAYKLTGSAKGLEAGHDRVKEEGFADSFTHYFSFKQFEVDSDALLNVDSLDDLVVIVEAKNKPSDADGTFIAYGVRSGLHVTTDTKRFNTTNGARSLELATNSGEGERYSQYNVLDTDYATTKAALDAILIVAA